MRCKSLQLWRNVHSPYMNSRLSCKHVKFILITAIRFTERIVIIKKPVFFIWYLIHSLNSLQTAICNCYNIYENSVPSFAFVCHGLQWWMESPICTFRALALIKRRARLRWIVGVRMLYITSRVTENYIVMLCSLYKLWVRVQSYPRLALDISKISFLILQTGSCKINVSLIILIIKSQMKNLECITQRTLTGYRVIFMGQIIVWQNTGMKTGVKGGYELIKDV